MRSHQQAPSKQGLLNERSPMSIPRTPARTDALNSAKWIASAVSALYELEVAECGCGFHIGLDATFVDQVADFVIICPACHSVIDTAATFGAEPSTIHRVVTGDLGNDISNSTKARRSVAM
ncbi:hypothetical protein ACWIGI_37570 [Nocardia sp. NPDC055321]